MTAEAVLGVNGHYRTHAERSSEDVHADRNIGLVEVMQGTCFERKEHGPKPQAHSLLRGAAANAHTTLGRRTLKSILKYETEGKTARGVTLCAKYGRTSASSAAP